MVASPRQRLILPLAPFGAGVAGAFTALLFLVLPSAALDSLVVDSGVAALLNAAQPPLGFTARAVLALGGGGTAALLVWVALFVAVGTRSIIVNRAPTEGNSVPTLRRADAHPDAPPRQPLFANRDLGTPFLEVHAEPLAAEPKPAPVPMGAANARPLPIDLDMPLATFDPVSFAAPDAPPAPAPDPVELTIEPLPLPREVRSAAPIPIRPDTIRAIDLIAASMQSAPSIRRMETESPASIRSLLDRLERSVAKREAEATPPAPARQESIRDTLEALRGMATRTG